MPPPLRTGALAAVLLSVGAACSSSVPPADPTPAADAGATDPPAGDDGGGEPPVATDAGATGDAGAAGAMDGGSGSGTADGCGLSPGDNDRLWSLDHGGRTRRFAVHVPAGYDPARRTPVVLDLHGRNSTASQQMIISGMRRKADEAGFIAVHPEGVAQTWNAGVCCGEAMSEDVDDVGFVAALLDELERSLCVDSGRVFATGLSNGGYMAHRLACELADRVAAVAPVAGPNGTVPCEPARPVSVLHFHGTDDGVVPYDGYGGTLSVPGTMRDWASRNGCDATSTDYLSEGDVRCERWGGCREGTGVELCTIDGGGHQWPGGQTIPFLGHNTDDIDATDAMWAFFQAHAR